MDLPKHGPQWKRLRQINGLILGILLASCVFFVFYDVLVEHIWWTSLSIYFPCGGLFVFGLLAWRKLSAAWLIVFGMILLTVDLFLIGYGGWLWMQGEMLWGPLTLGFSFFTVALTWSSLRVGKQLRSVS